MRAMWMPVVYGFGLSHLSVHKLKKKAKLDLKVLWNISLLRDPESLKALKGIGSHIQDLLQELLKTRVGSQNFFGTKLYWAW